MSENFQSLAEERDFVKRFGPAATKALLNSGGGIPVRITRATVYSADYTTGEAFVQEFGDPTIKEAVPWLPPYVPELGDVCWYLKFGNDGFLLGTTVKDDVGTFGFSVPGRGIVGWGSWVGADVVLSTSLSIYTMICRALSVPLITDHLYRVVAAGGHTLLSTGSGFAFSDAWEFRLQVDEGSGFGNLTYQAQKRIRDNEDHVGTKRWIMPELTGYHKALGDGTATFNFEAAKISGAATVGASVTGGSGAQPFTILVEDLGILALGE